VPEAVEESQPEDGITSYSEAEEQEDDELPIETKKGSCFRFVDKGPFQIISAVVILVNTVMVFIEMDKPEMGDKFYVANQVTLCFYIFELLCRVLFFGRLFLCGSRWKLAWNMLDVVVVSAGIFDQWILPFIRLEPDSPIYDFILFLRLLRIFRVIKILRVFLESDLSWTERPAFQSFIGGVIAFNALLMGFETDIKWKGWFYIEQVLLLVYVFELSVRLKRDGMFFLSCHNNDIIWNSLDFTIVVSSVVDSWLVPLVGILSRVFVSNKSNAAGSKPKGMSMSQVMMLMRMMRLMRILRLVKLVKSVRPLYILVTGVVAAFQGVLWVLVLTIVVLYAAGILATRLLGHGLIFPPGTQVPEGVWVFKTVPDSMFTLFRVMSGSQSDEEASAIEELMITLPIVKFGFIFFMVTSSWTLLSILTAVVSENMITTTGQQEEELQMASDEEDRQALTQRLRDLFGSIDKTQDGTIALQDIEEFLSDKGNALKTAKVCCVATRNVVDVLRTLGAEGEPVQMETFVNVMVDVGNPVTEQSMRKLESLFKESRRLFDDGANSVAGQIDSWQTDEMKQNASVLRPQRDTSALTTLLHQLTEEQRLSSQALSQLHASFEGLLSSQEELMAQSVESESQMARLEASLVSLDLQCKDALEKCEADVADVKHRFQAELSHRSVITNGK
jgi:voltage-gated sodium channel